MVALSRCLVYLGLLVAHADGARVQRKRKVATGEISASSAEAFVAAQFKDWLGNCTAFLESMSDEFLWEDTQTITSKEVLMHDCLLQAGSTTTVYDLETYPLHFMTDDGVEIYDYSSITVVGMQDIEMPGLGWLCFDFAISERLEIAQRARFGITSKYWGGHYISTLGRCNATAASLTSTSREEGTLIQADEVFTQETVTAFAEAQFDDYLGNCAAFVDSMSDEFFWQDGKEIRNNKADLLKHCQSSEGSATTIFELKVLPLFFLNFTTQMPIYDWSNVVLAGSQELEMPGFGWLCFRFGINELLDAAPGSRFGITARHWGGHFLPSLGRCGGETEPDPAPACPLWCSLRLCLAKTCINNCNFCAK